MSKRTIKKNTFSAIRAELLEGSRPQSIIAADYQVSASTVSSVNNARTWSNYQKGIKAMHPLRGPVTSPAAARGSVVSGDQPAPVQAELVESVARTEATLAAELKQLENFATRDELKAMRNIHAGRLDAAHSNYRALHDRVDRHSVRFVLVGALALVALGRVS